MAPAICRAFSIFQPSPMQQQNIPIHEGDNGSDALAESMNQFIKAKAGLAASLKTPLRASLAELDALFALLQRRAFCGEL
ncbi:hypothetical protein [Opitutus terrae]|uniref:Uncharacterized protein n=1 Tax=Opitutus terrae (strain DSM 11246 / JCM 15787 / PB90-1) TaxID=452637 RepID=B1ZYW6_OPITP|nr:hypothetical protein [Opitutus terrae]ACB76289.1 hypothetical protein Oter_3008 [Opitutus terrae PB90-1]